MSADGVIADAAACRMGAAKSVLGIEDQAVADQTFGEIKEEMQLLPSVN